jgi:hypothetical protein
VIVLVEVVEWKRFFFDEQRPAISASGESQFKRSSCFNHTFVAKRTKKAIEKRLRLALLVTAQCLCEQNEFAQGVLYIVRHLCASEGSRNFSQWKDASQAEKEYALHKGRKWLVAK